MKFGKKFTALLAIFSILIGTLYVPLRVPVQASELDIEFPEYYTDPNVISDTDFFGSWEGTGWATEPMFSYQDYPELEAVEAAAIIGDYSTAKEELLKYYRDKCSGYSMKMQGTGATKQYLDYVMYKNNMLNTVGSGVSATAVATVDNEWSWIEADITNLLTAADFHDAEKTFTFIFTALNKDDSVVEIKSSEDGAEFAPRVEVSVNSQMVEFPVTEDAYISAGSNTYETFGSKDENILKVAESATSIGKLADPVDENTFRTYLKFNFDKIVRGDTVNKAVLKIYARNAGETGKKDMLLFKSGETAWQEATISWGCGDITHNMYSFDGDPMPGWDMTKAAFGNARIVTNPIRFEDTAIGVVGYYHTTKNEEVMYHLIRMLISYVTMQPDPAFNNNLSTAQRGYSLARLVTYAIQSPMMTADVFAGFVKYFKTVGDYLESAKGFNSNNNWGVYQSSALLGLAWQYNEITTASKWEKTAFERLAFMAENVNFSDGGSVESAVDYSRQSTNLFVSRLSTLVKMTGKSMEDLTFSEDFWEELYKQGKFIMDTAGPGIVAPQWGDDGSFNENYKSVLKTTAELINADDLLWASTDGDEGTKPEYTSVLYPVKGMAIMRSDWSDDALWLHINNDKARSSHGHADDLSVIMFANGRYLLADPLIYLYDPTDNPIRQWLLSTRAHNTVMINNQSQAMPKSETDPGLIAGWETNEAFDYVKMMTETYSGYKHTRDVMFIKNKFWIINDLLEPDDKTQLNQYEQLWHFLPDSNISVDPVTMETRTNFGDADIRVIPVEPMDYEPVNNFFIEDYQASGSLDSYMQDDTSSGIKVGYYSADYGQVSNAEYSSYRKVNVAGDTTFNTILFPITIANDYDVETMAIKTDLDAAKASAMRIDYTQKATSAKTTGVFYNLLDEQLVGERIVESYSTDGQTMYVERNDGILSSVVLREGSHVKEAYSDTELIKSLSNIGAVSVKWQSKDIYIEAMNELNLEDITIYSNERAIDNVYLNGVALEKGEFKIHGRYVYFGDNPIIPDDTVIDSPIDISGGGGNSHGNSGSQSASGDSGAASGSGPGSGSGGQSVNGGSGVASGSGSGSGSGGQSASGGSGVASGPDSGYESTASRYSDVESDRWSQMYIEKLSEMGVLSGFGDGTFCPENDITRDEFLKVILEAFKIPVTNEADIIFNDVQPGVWSEKYIKTAAKLGIIKGISTYEFGSGMTLSRQDAAVIIKRVLDYLDISFTESDTEAVLSDVASIDEYAAESVDLLVSQGIIIGNENGEFIPHGNVSREQIAKIVFLALEKSGLIYEA